MDVHGMKIVIIAWSLRVGWEAKKMLKSGGI